MSEKQYDYLIVPCPGNPSFDECEVTLSDLVKSKNKSDPDLYLGAKDRMRAAILVAENTNKVILVGGSESKVTAMYLYFTKEMNKRMEKNTMPKLICLISKPDSTGNLAAVKIFLEKEGIISGKFAIISNDYHLPRLKLISNALFSASFNLEMISAETILKKGTLDKMYQKELMCRKTCEEAGCRDWENGQYNNQEKIIPWTPNFWTCKKLTLDYQISDLNQREK